MPDLAPGDPRRAIDKQRSQERALQTRDQVQIDPSEKATETNPTGSKPHRARCSGGESAASVVPSPPAVNRRIPATSHSRHRADQDCADQCKHPPRGSMTRSEAQDEEHHND